MNKYKYYDFWDKILYDYGTKYKIVDKHNLYGLPSRLVNYLDKKYNKTKNIKNLYELYLTLFIHIGIHITIMTENNKKEIQDYIVKKRW